MTGAAPSPKLSGRSVYLAQPIDLGSLTTAQARHVKYTQTALTLAGAVVFSPRGGFQLDPERAGPPIPYIERVNEVALVSASALVALYPEAATIGVPMEIGRAQAMGIPTVVVTAAADLSYTLAGLDQSIAYVTGRFDALASEWLADRTPQSDCTGCRRPVPFRLDAPDLLPTHAHGDDAGFDLITSVETKIEPGAFADVPCGCAVQLPPGVWGMVTGRSSTIRKHQLLVNPGIIDTGFRGALFAGTWNLGDAPFVVPVGMRIAQLILLPNLAAGMVPVPTAQLDPSDRGTSGFGSTGV